MKINSPQFNLIQRACTKASKILIRDFGEIEKLQVSEKGPGDFVTASDKRVEKTIISELENPNQIRLARIGCPGKATGGRIGYFEGQNLTACAIKGAERIKNDPINLTGGDQQNLRSLGKSAKAVRFLKNFLGPAAIAV